MVKHLPARLRGNPAIFQSARGSVALLALLGGPLSGQYENFWERFEFQKTASATLAYDSNIGGTGTEVGDTIISGQAVVTAEQQFRYARLGIELTGVAAHYFEYDQLDYQNIYLNWLIDASERMGTRRLTYSVNFNIQENTETREETQGQSTIRQLNAGGEASYLMTRQLSLGAGVDYSMRDPQGSIRRLVENDAGDFIVDESQEIVGVTTTSFSGFLSWQQSQDLSYRFTVSHRIFSSDDSDEPGFVRNYQDGSSTGLNASLRGSILPKITGTLGVGLEARSLDNGTDETTPTFNASLAWAIDELTNVSVAGNKRFSASVNGANSDQTSVSVNFSRRISRSISFSAGASLQLSEYEFADSRIDSDPLVDSRSVESNSYTLRASLSRSMTEWSVLQIGLSNTNYDSDFRSGNSDRLRGTLTYSVNF